MTLVLESTLCTNRGWAGMVGPKRVWCVRRSMRGCGGCVCVFARESGGGGAGEIIVNFIYISNYSWYHIHIQVPLLLHWHYCYGWLLPFISSCYFIIIVLISRSSSTSTPTTAITTQAPRTLRRIQSLPSPTNYYYYYYYYYYLILYFYYFADLLSFIIINICGPRARCGRSSRRFSTRPRRRT